MGICYNYWTIMFNISVGDNMVTQAVEENIEEIVELIKEVRERFDKTQISVSVDVEISKYNAKIIELSDGHVYLQKFGSDTNVEVGQYRINPICDNDADRVMLTEELSQ